MRVFRVGRQQHERELRQHVRRGVRGRRGEQNRPGGAGVHGLRHELARADQLVVVLVELLQRVGRGVPLLFAHLAVAVGVEVLHERGGQFRARRQSAHPDLHVPHAVRAIERGQFVERHLAVGVAVQFRERRGRAGRRREPVAHRLPQRARRGQERGLLRVERAVAVAVEKREQQRERLVPDRGDGHAVHLGQ
ncbi:MAG: hypothetical protein J0I06_02960 [Planctomycetes bacterium]|nr:hypothetical protein [Planctomycetota bacterium]